MYSFSDQSSSSSSSSSRVHSIKFLMSLSCLSAFIVVRVVFAHLPVKMKYISTWPFLRRCRTRVEAHKTSRARNSLPRRHSPNRNPHVPSNKFGPSKQCKPRFTCKTKRTRLREPARVPPNRTDKCEFASAVISMSCLFYLNSL